ncbi:MAG: peptidoglycan-binding protein LysM [Lautropia sp.]
MGLMSFMKEAGEKLFGRGKAQAAAPAAPEAVSPEAANQAAADAIVDYIIAQNLNAEGLSVKFDGGASTVTVSGMAPDQQTKEKILLCCGNVAGVAQVNDDLTVAQAADPSQYYTVVRGDTLSKISKEYYGNANLYNQIFEANRPMLTHPDKIYPGQVLRIPPKATA